MSVVTKESTLLAMKFRNELIKMPYASTSICPITPLLLS